MSRPAQSEGDVAQNHKAKLGEWKVLPYDSQIEAVHMALLPTGKVLYFSGFRELEAAKTETRLWNPKTGNIKAPQTPEDIFCAGHSFLPDGRLLSAGGTLESRTGFKLPSWFIRLLRPIIQILAPIVYRIIGNPVLQTGHTILYLFDPKTENWEFAGDMPEGRWYPTNTTLPDGRILILSGRDMAGGVGSKEKMRINRRVDVYDAEKGVKQVATIPEGEMEHGDQEKEHHGFPSLYPRMHVLPLSEREKGTYPAGKAFCSGYGPETKMLNLDTWEWEDVAKLTEERTRHDGCSVLLPLRPPDYRARILTCGGSEEGSGETARPTNTAEMIDFGEESPKWKLIDPMQDGRDHAGAMILPDGNVLVVGGSSKGLFGGSIYTVEVFDSVEDKWEVVAPITVPRGYHATTILLSDGRILVSGTTPYGNEELRMEVYSPGYLFKGERPIITRVPESISYGEPFEVEYESKEGLMRSAVLVRPGSMTHAFDMDQRYVELEITDKATNRLTAKAPPDAHIAPPGYYMLFLVSGDGVPSEAKFVHLPIKR